MIASSEGRLVVVMPHALTRVCHYSLVVKSLFVRGAFAPAWTARIDLRETHHPTYDVAADCFIAILRHQSVVPAYPITRDWWVWPTRDDADQANVWRSSGYADPRTPFLSEPQLAPRDTLDEHLLVMRDRLLELGDARAAFLSAALRVAL